MRCGKIKQMTQVSGVKKSPFSSFEMGTIGSVGSCHLEWFSVVREEIASEDQNDFDDPESP